MAGGDDQNPPPPAKIDSSSPYYLGPQDRPGDFITPTRLTSDNYDAWASDIQTALEARRKFEFLDGTINNPSPPCTKSDWTAINAMLISWITNTIDPNLKSTLTKFREAKALWDHLKNRFAQTNGPRVQQLRSSIARTEQSKQTTISEYYGKLHTLWQELDRHEQLISCSCCASCIAGKRHEERREQARLHDFLMGLHPDYSALRTQILSQDPLPNIDRAYQLISQEERVRGCMTAADNTPPEAVGFAVRSDQEIKEIPPAGQSRGRGRGSDRPPCLKCRRNNHDTANCWSAIVCTHCKKKGHPSTHCYQLVGKPESKINGQARTQSRANATVGPTTPNSSPNNLFTPEQWKAMANQKYNCDGD